jgi:uncharacterized protein YbcI
MKAADSIGSSALASTLADQIALLYEARPGDPRVGLNENMLTFAFEGGLTSSDECLLAAGRKREVRAFREHFLQAASTQLSEIVTSFAGAEVTFFFAAFDPASRTTSCFFVLDSEADPQREQRRAIRNWSEQVRRNARDLRARHDQIRSEHRRLREGLHRLL